MQRSHIHVDMIVLCSSTLRFGGGNARPTGYTFYDILDVFVRVEATFACRAIVDR